MNYTLYLSTDQLPTINQVLMVANGGNNKYECVVVERSLLLNPDTAADVSWEALRLINRKLEETEDNDD